MAMQQTYMGLLQALHTPQARPNFQCAENKQYLVPYSHSVGKRNVHPLREKTYVVVHLLVWFGHMLI
jgi:hypothetical protein